jgi:hypothetical protein
MQSGSCLWFLFCEGFTISLYDLRRFGMIALSA